MCVPLLCYADSDRILGQRNEGVGFGSRTNFFPTALFIAAACQSEITFLNVKTIFITMKKYSN